MTFFKPRKVITRLEGGQLVPYLVRWNLFECSLFSIKIHKILISDDDCMHDHPWAFISFILKGGYVEQSLKRPYAMVIRHLQQHENPMAAIPGFMVKKVLYGAGSVLYRPAHYIHRLEVYQPALTLVITFKKTRAWGFYTPWGWIDGEKYSKQEHCG